ncbi:hypothetical protein OIY81_3316 [Cryptosporidium canis]|nr:hypothetical protein OIY81_3316 [Cryptosporidium canis]
MVELGVYGSEASDAAYGLGNVEARTGFYLQRVEWGRGGGEVESELEREAGVWYSSKLGGCSVSWVS